MSTDKERQEQEQRVRRALHETLDGIGRLHEGEDDPCAQEARGLAPGLRILYRCLDSFAAQTPATAARADLDAEDDPDEGAPPRTPWREAGPNALTKRQAMEAWPELTEAVAVHDVVCAWRRLPDDGAGWFIHTSDRGE
jgi:hypothetical protein